MKRILLFTAALLLCNCHCSIVKAQNPVFGYTHQGTTLYYSVDGSQQATVRGSVEDTAFASALWTEQTKPTGNRPACKVIVL